MAIISSPLADSDAMSTSTTTEINKDLAVLAESMHVLDSISRLPAEILAIVFEFVEEEKRFDESANNNAPACLAITHVCRYWRNVALDCPSLWRFIRSSSPYLVGIMLERSRNAPLVVTYKSPVSLQGCLEPVLAQLPRVKVLQFPSPAPDVDRIINLLSSQPAPLLENFDLRKPWEGRDWFITDTIFQGQAPRLRSVELGNFSLSWTAHIFSRLQTLSVRGITFFPTTLPELLSALRRMTALEQLAIDTASVVSEITMPLDNGKVPLARLKSIALGTLSIQTATSLFSQLAIPVDAKIALRLKDILGLQDFSDLFSAMDRYPDTPGSVIRSLRVIYFSYKSFCFQLSTSTTMDPPESWNSHDYDDAIRLSIHFNFHGYVDVAKSILFDICRLVTQPEDRIQTFYLGSDFLDPDPDFWRAGSAFLPDVETIHLNRTLIGGLVEMLEIDEGEQECNVPYHSLRALDVYTTVFIYEDDEYERLRDIMKMRAGRGAGIRALRLEKCLDLDAEMVQGFRRVGGAVDWDEYVEPLGDREIYEVTTPPGWVNWTEAFDQR
ncbi:hypothetical protein DEU56DRAFT_324319 [Suillus clintonianus]|uniref:uncharacterized protein n=1 Tax=Suillus clintonianus TaxID=1904413 RepID=UPI001B85E890|nr:uncharacterized protein DEU56DRAFT_324319 [Suillus clintonianus]KAG2139244.1 hypothetical protein DEU56DRAFT_324319 [Suillus clintonianus]